MPEKPLSGPAAIVGLLLTIPYLAIGGEFLYRFVDGYQLTTQELTPRATRPAAADQSGYEKRLLAGVTFDPSVSSTWFFQPPSPLSKPVIEELQRRSTINTNLNGSENYQWNENYLRHPDVALADYLHRLKEDEVFAFKGYDDTVFPHYRLYPDSTTSLGVTNAFGWLASDVTLEKPDNTIRIGLLGDSTSHNTYGRYLQAYLTSWAESQGNGLKFEVLNAGRQASGLQDLASILRYELAPMGLDYVYQYLAPHIPYDDFVTLPPGVTYGKPPPSSALTDVLAQPLKPLSLTSALARHIVQNLTDTSPDSELREPPKPQVKVNFPADVQEYSVDADNARKVHYLDAMFKQYEVYKRIAEEFDITPLVSTERLYVPNGARLTHLPHRGLFDVINGAQFWPLSYRDLQRLLDFHNRAITAWARQQNVALVDIDGLMPRIPELYPDSVHNSAIGERLRAWVIFQSLLPLIRRDLIRGRLPRPGPKISGRHPYIDPAPLRVSRQEVIETYDAELKKHSPPPPPPPPLDEAKFNSTTLSLLALKAAAAGASVNMVESKARVITSPQKLAYAAILPIPAEAKNPGPGLVKVRMRVDKGRMVVVVLNNDASQAITSRTIAAGKGITLISLAVSELANGGSVLFCNLQETEGISSAAEIFSIEVLASK